MAEAFRMFDSNESEKDFEGFLINETVKKTQPNAAGASAITIVAQKTMLTREVTSLHQCIRII